MIVLLFHAWAMLFAVFMVHLVFHSGFDLVAFGVAIVDSWPFRMNLGFFTKGRTFTQLLDGAFSPGVQLSVWRCGPHHAHPGLQTLRQPWYFAKNPHVP